MAISDVLEKIGKAIFETPFGANRLSKDAPDLAEIRIAVLDAVKAKSHRASGKSVFAFNIVRLLLRGIPDDQASTFQSDFLEQYFADELKAGLTRSSYRFPADLRVEILTTPALPLAGEDWLAVETALEQAETHVPAHGTATLILLQGTANQAELVLEKTRTHIGRTAEVFRTAGPSRKNDLFFSEETEVNRTVSREHAHIVRSAKTGEYRIINDRVYKGEDNCGIWIVRDSMSLPVHRSAKGTQLKDGDELHLGSAIMRFVQE